MKWIIIALIGNIVLALFIGFVTKNYTNAFYVLPLFIPFFVMWKREEKK